MGRSRVFSDFDLSLSLNGQIVGLFGPNGAGKTTLMRVLTGFINRYDGQVTVPHGAVSYLPDAPFLYPFLRLRDCIDLYGGMFPDFSAEAAVHMLTRLNLALDRTVAECSKGMSEQLHLVLCLARQVQLYVFDEPLAAVDPLTREVMIELIRDHRAEGATVLLSTHLIHGLEDLFDEVVFIHDGKLVLHGTTRDLTSDGSPLEEKFKEVMRAQALAG
jgi:ABC-2 type transport system ATP-binding protein